MSIADLRYALRLLVRTPVFTATAVLSLALGIGASTTIFGLTDALLLRPRPGLSEPARLVDLGRATNGRGFDNMSYPLFEGLRERVTLFEGLAAFGFEPRPMSLGDTDQPERVHAAIVSGNYFDVLGTRAAAGRFFRPEEDRTPGEAPVVVLNHAFWTKRFGADPALVGGTIRLNGLPYTVVGVAEPGFAGTTFFGADLWVPVAMQAQVRGEPGSTLLTEPRAVWHLAVGRLKPGVSLAQARAELDAVMAGLKQERPDAWERWSLVAAPSARVPQAIRTPVAAFLGLLFALTGVVLLIACSNVAGMLLARATTRRREVATRLAIGADRGRILRQLLTETLVLFAAAGAAGAILSVWMIRGVNSFMPALPFPAALDLQVDVRALGFALAVAIATGLVFGLAPARQALRLDLAPTLHGHGSTTDRRRFALRHALVVGQVALSLLLLVTTGLFLRGLQAAAAIDPGYAVDNVQIVSFDTRLAGYREEAAAAFVERVVERVRQVPGVEQAATGRVIPLQGSSFGLGAIRVPGFAGPGGQDLVPADWDVVSPAYFATLGVPVVEGRAFQATDDATRPFVAVVNETFARQVWPNGSAVGQRIFQVDPRSSDPGQAIEIVGVARDADYQWLGEAPQPFLYVPHAQFPMSQVELFVRHAPGRAVAGDVRAVVTGLDRNLPILLSQTFEEAIGVGLLPQRLAASIAGGVGTLGLLLAALGLYGLTAFSVAQRTREIAVRMALGATRGAVLGLVLRQGAVLAAAGALVGGALAVGAGVLIQSLLASVPATDPVAFAAGAVVLAGVLLVATWLPARRAAALDPARSLRAE